MFESQLFWYKLVFMTELLLSETMFCFRLKRRKNFWLRLCIALVVCYGVAVGFPLFEWSYNAAYISLLFISLFTVTLGMCALCFEEPFVNILFCGVAAYAVQHMAFQLYSMIINATGLNNEMPIGIYDETSVPSYTVFTGMIYFMAYAVVYWLMFILFANRIKRNKDIGIKSVSLLLIVSFVVLVCVVLNAVVTYSVYETYNPVLLITIEISLIISCILELCVQFGLLTNKTIQSELDVVYRLWRQEQKQFAASKTNIDLINMKCHDLKQQIRRIGTVGSISESALKEIEDVVSIYDLAVKTGNSALDVILTEKSLHCASNNINFTVVADGKRLDFMNEVDLYTLFGNAIDNAIEAVMKLGEEKRVISFTTNETGELFLVNIRNYFSGNVIFESGLPVTTKEDKDYHGFGMKSIMSVAEKYDADVSVVTDGDVFNLNILFPLKN